jgi:hypothetical protein
MKNVFLLLFVALCVLSSSCSYIMPPKKVACCEQKAACCYDQMCCLPRYAKAAGVEPKAFTPESPNYASAEDLVPPPGSVVEKPKWYSRFNPYPWLTEERAEAAAKKKLENPQEASKNEETKESFWGRLWPF